MLSLTNKLSCNHAVLGISANTWVLNKAVIDLWQSPDNLWTPTDTRTPSDGAIFGHPPNTTTLSN